MDEANIPGPINLTTTVKRGKKHYFVDGDEWPSVTTILKDIVNKPALMGWARKMMKEAWSEAVAKMVDGSPRKCNSRSVNARSLY